MILVCLTLLVQEGAQFDALDDLTDGFFKEANKISDESVWIVSNANPKWIELSMGAILPKLKKTLYDDRQGKLRVISARQRPESDDKSVWKEKIFTQLIRRYVPPRFQRDEQPDENPAQVIEGYSIISIGDSENDAECLMQVKTKLTNTLRKTVKLVDRPTPGQLVKQLEAMKEKLKFIVESKRDMHLVATWGV